MRGFTLLEMLIVIMIIALLSLISLKLNRGQIDQMRASNEREQRLARHSKYNTLLTNTNYLNDTKITNTIRTYTPNNKTITITATPPATEKNNANTVATQSQFTFTHNTIAEEFTITKTPLTLGCTRTNNSNSNSNNNSNSNSNNNNNTITIQTARDKSLCFTLNTELCTRTSTPCSN